VVGVRRRWRWLQRRQNSIEWLLLVRLHLLVDEADEAVEVGRVELDVVVARAGHPQRLDRARAALVDRQAVAEVDHLVLRAVNDQSGRVDAVDLVDTACTACCRNHTCKSVWLPPTPTALQDTRSWSSFPPPKSRKSYAVNFDLPPNRPKCYAVSDALPVYDFSVRKYQFYY